MNPFLPQLRLTFAAAVRDARSTTVRYRLAAATRLGDVESDAERTQASELLAQLLNDERAEIRAAAARSLLSLQASEHAESLTALLNDSSPNVVAAALMACSVIAPEGVTASLDRWLAHASADIRLIALQHADTLAAVGSEHAVRALADSDEDVRFVAASLLAARGDAIALPHLTSALDHPNNALAAAIMLGDFGAEHPPRAGHVSDVVTTLHTLNVSGARTRDPWRRIALHRAIISFGALPQIPSSEAIVTRTKSLAVLEKELLRWRSPARDYAISVVHELHLTELLPVLQRLQRTRRMVDREALQRAIEHIEHSR